MIEAIVFLWLFLLIFIDYRARTIEKRIEQLEQKLNQLEKGKENV
jgi:preprotein translocase subunit YajC